MAKQLAVRRRVETGVISSLIQACRNLLRQAPPARKPVTPEVTDLMFSVVKKLRALRVLRGEKFDCGVAVT